MLKRRLYVDTIGGFIIYIGNSSHPVTRIYTNDYGSTLPSAGSKGRIFFKKV